MKKQILLLFSATAALLSGCVSDSDLVSVQSNVSRLNQRVGNLENELSSTKAELAIVKEQRVVRLPTGAPTQTQARNTASPSYAMSSEDQSFSAAINQYKSGDTQGAIVALTQFNDTYPNSSHRNEALFTLGQAAYTVRDYNRAQQALEPLAFQPTNGQVNQPAVALLQKVYQAQGNTADASRLTGYIQSLSQPTATQTAPVTTGSVIMEAAPNEPLRPQIYQ